MKENETKKSNSVLFTVIAVATLLVAVVGASFAYFTASVSGNDTASSVIVKTANIGEIVYTNGTQVLMDNAYPGAYSNEVTFTIKSTGDTSTTTQYAIKWVNVKNDFAVKSDLIYTLTGSGTGAISKSNLQAPSSAATIGTASIKGGVTHTYKIRLHFRETGSDQNSNQGKTFIGKIEVDTADSAADTYYTSTAPSGTTTKPSPY